MTEQTFELECGCTMKIGITIDVSGQCCTGGGGGAFTPSDIPDLAAWYDLSDETSVTYDGGTFAISQVDDLSGNGVHLTNAGSNQPKYSVANGYMYTDGNDGFTMPLSIPEEYTIVLKAKYTDLSGGSANALVGIPGSFNALIGMHGGTNFRVYSTGVNVAAATTDEVFIAAAYGAEGVTSSSWLDETEYTGTRGAHGTVSNLSFFAGKGNCTAGARIYQAAVYNRTLTENEISQLRDHFNGV